MLLLRKFDKLLRVVDVVGEGLLHENVLAIFEGFLHEWIVGRDRGDYRDCVEIRGSKDFVAVRGRVNCRIGFLRFREDLGVEVGYGFDTTQVKALEIADYVGAPITVTDNADADHMFGSSKERHGNLHGEHGITY